MVIDELHKREPIEMKRYYNTKLIYPMGHLRNLSECLNETLFGTLRDARKTLEEWQEDYNWRRPHSALGNLTPMEFL